MKTMQTAFLAAAAALALAACGDNPADAPEPPPAPPATEVPASALTSPAAYAQFAGSLAPSETASPLDVSRVTAAPTSETEAPVSF